MNADCGETRYEVTGWDESICVPESAEDVHISQSKRTQETNIVEVDGNTINCYRELGPLPSLEALFLAENFTRMVAARSFLSIEWTWECLQHIWLVYL